MEIFEVIVLNISTRDETSLSVEIDEGETTENIVIKAKLLEQEITASNYNYFPAYQEFRDKLLRSGYGMKCNGSRINAVQSGMMGANDKIYLVKMGVKAQMKDIVSIWDYADIDDFPDTERQIAFLINGLNPISSLMKQEDFMSKRLLHTPEGVRDIYGKEYERKLYVERKIHEKLHLYGYEDIQTPAFEFFDVFSKEVGTTPSKELYKFFDKENNTLVLRPDFTPSIARCAAKYFCEEQAPMRFSYMGNTFNNTSNLQGKLKEVTQMGAELINEPSVEADGEMISLVVEALLNAGLKRFQVSIGEVEYFKGLCSEAGLDEETEYDLRECISGKNYFAAQELLIERNVAEPYHGKLLKVADMFGNMCSLTEAKEMVSNARSLAAIERLEKLYNVLKAYGVAEYISFDLGMLSKYNYYTGVIFKAYTYGVGDAVVKGGRYDHLLKQFGKEAPAVGFCVVIDSIMEALSRQKVEIPLEEAAKTLYYDENDYEEKLAEAQRLRRENVAAVLVRKG